MGGLADRVYEVSPVWLQLLGINAYGLMWHRRRLGGRFKKALAGFQAREYFTPEQWRDDQTQRLRALLTRAGTWVPYYREVFRGVGLSLDDIRGFELEDLRRLPLLHKQTLRDDPDSFLAEDMRGRRLNTYGTSGTTGTPLAIKYAPGMHQQWWAALEARCRLMAGVDRTMSRATFGGRIVVPRGASKPPYWRYNLVERQLYMSAFHISPANARLYVDALNRHRPDYMAGYASSNYLLSRLIVEQGLEVHRPKAMVVTSEKLTAEMRRTMEEAFGCPVFDSFGCVEGCCLASECEQHSMHVSPDVSIVELLDDDGGPVAPGVPGEFVATGLLNDAQPLIRYRLGDRATWAAEPCGCGRHMPVLEELIGRMEDVVIGPDGRETVRFHGIYIDLPNVREGQVIQETLNHIRIRLATTPDFSEEERQTIDKRFKERLGPVTVTIELVDHIERTDRGKFRAVISKVQRTPSR